MSEKHFRLLAALMPPGRAWDLSAGKNLTALIQGLSGEYGRAESNADRLVEEAFADSVTVAGLLPDFERLLEIREPAATEEGRRRDVVARLTARGGQSVGFFLELAASLGASVVIQEHRELVAGFAAGDYVSNYFWPYTWRVYDPDGDPVPAAVVAEFEWRKPAHSFIVFNDPWERDE